MLFTLEALKAKHGDSLFLHCGSADDPEIVLIDGGPPGVYTKSLKPRLKEISKLLGIGGPVPISLAMVSHIDQDHIKGILDLTSKDLKVPKSERLADIDAIWHNSFSDDILSSAGASLDELVSVPSTRAFAASAGVDVHSLAIAAGVGQGRELRTVIKKMRRGGNPPFNGPVLATTKKKSTIELPKSGVELTVIGPTSDQLDELREEWKDFLKEQKEKEEEERLASAAAFLDKSAANLSSIVAIAKLGEKRMLLTGDARGDNICHSLKKFGLFKNSKAHFEIFKIPHHGSDRNVDPDLFRQITADHYVFSGDGKHGNPEIDTLRMITRARGRAKYTMHFTYELDKVADFVRADRKDHTRNYEVVFALPGDYSLWIDLGEDLTY
jgi:hypothetical protein